MFESFEKRQPRKSVVQPVLALAVHAGLISLALGGGPNLPLDRTPIPRIPPTIFVMPVTDGLTLPGGTEGVIPVTVPIEVPQGLPPLTGLQLVPGPRRGFDPSPYLTIGSPDSVGTPGVAVLTESDLTDPPRALHLAEPRYPEALRQAGIEGAVIVTYVVDAAGLVEPTSIRIVSSDHPAFAEAVLASVGTARFTPGRVHGRAVRVLVRQVIRFATRS
jgi:periplasmic protein TonB